MVTEKKFAETTDREISQLNDYNDTAQDTKWYMSWLSRGIKWKSSQFCFDSYRSLGVWSKQKIVSFPTIKWLVKNIYSVANFRMHNSHQNTKIQALLQVPAWKKKWHLLSVTPNAPITTFSNTLATMTFHLFYGLCLQLMKGKR